MCNHAMCISVLQITPRIRTKPYFFMCMTLTPGIKETLKLFRINTYRLNLIKKSDLIVLILHIFTLQVLPVQVKGAGRRHSRSSSESTFEHSDQTHVTHRLRQ